MPWTLMVRKSGYFEMLEISLAIGSKMESFSQFVKAVGLSLEQISKMTKIDLAHVEILNRDGLIGGRAKKQISESAPVLKRKKSR